MERWVLMVTPNAFPDRDAGAVRDLAFAKIYMELGYSVCHIGQGTENMFGTYEGVEYISLYQRADNFVQKLMRFCSYAHKLKSVVNNYEMFHGSPKIIHLYDAPTNGIKFLKEYAKKVNAKLVHDSVEWYSPCEFKKGKFDKSYILKDRLNRKYIDSAFRVISISSFLQNYFMSRGIKTVRVPVIMDTHMGISKPVKNNNGVNLVYAGSPASKDLLKNMLRAYCMLPSKILKGLYFRIVGVSEEQAIELQMCTKEQLNGIRDNIAFFGRVSREKVIEILAISDFSVLVRPSKERYAMAGYPTKSVEAMMNSVAMLCNISSDLGMYLKDGYNAVIIQDEGVTSLKQGFERVAKMDKSEIFQLRTNAQKTAVDCFDYRNYIDTIYSLIEG